MNYGKRTQQVLVSGLIFLVLASLLTSLIARTIQTELTNASQPQLYFANFMDVHGSHTPFRSIGDDLNDCLPSFTTLDFACWNVNSENGYGDYSEEIDLVRQLYVAEVDYLDRIIADLIASIHDRVDRETMFVITADYSENLAYRSDDYLINNVKSISEALLYVPFDSYDVS